MDKEKHIKTIKQFFAISVAAFEMRESIRSAFGIKGSKSFMHCLHLKALDEINKSDPDMNKISVYLETMEKVAKRNSEKTDKN